MTGWADAIAFVTGGGSGIGRALSLALAQRSARVVVTDIDGSAAARVAVECGPGAEAHPLDVRDARAVDALVTTVARRLGRLDYLFNNAGVGMGGEVHELSMAHWDRVLDINVRGVIHGICAAYPLMVSQGAGHIVNTASLAGLVPAPLMTPYSMTKHAVVGLSRSLRAEAAPLGVRVSVLCPGFIDTPILDKVGHPELPPVASQRDGRGFLARSGVTPYPATAFAEEALAAIARNRAVIVIPRSASRRLQMARWFPSLVEKRTATILAAERAYRLSQA